jgi:NAD(P)-dependent dehydrogenase (short-subunit alcohol dehydrogenase family)
MNENLPVATVTGVGPGTGAAIVRRFARGGYSVAMLARTIADNAPLSRVGMKATILRAIF